MAVTQYIGARYVPVFANPAEWNDNRTYEPLTIVLHEGNSYTSKQAVPVGIDIKNENFWALTANYNAQVEAYRKETKEAVDTAKEAVDTAKEAVDTAKEAATSVTAESARAVAVETALNNAKQGLFRFDTRDDLAKSTLDFNTDTVVTVLKYASDKPYAPCSFTVSETKSDNNSVELKNGKYANMLVDGVVRPEWYGADYDSDASEAIQSCVDLAYATKKSVVIYFGNNSFGIANTVNVPDAAQNITFEGFYRDVNGSGGIHALSSNITLIRLGTSEAKFDDDLSFGVSFKNIYIYGYPYTGVTGIDMHCQVRGFFENVDVTHCELGVSFDTVWDYSFINFNVFNSNKAMLFKTESAHNGDCNALHFVNSHFESNNVMIDGQKMLDCQFTNCKFEGGATIDGYEAALNLNDVVNCTFTACFFSCGVGTTYSRGYLYDHGRQNVINACEFIGSFAKTIPLYSGASASVYTANVFQSYTDVKNGYMMELNNAGDIIVAHNTANTGIIHVYANRCNIIDNVMGFTSQGEAKPTVAIDGGSYNTINTFTSGQGGSYPITGQTINGTLMELVSGTVNYDSDKTLMPANVIICKGDANITLSGYALLNRNHLKIIANGHSYTFNGQSFTTNTEWYAANGQWYQG